MSIARDTVMNHEFDLGDEAPVQPRYEYRQHAMVSMPPLTPPSSPQIVIAAPRNSRSRPFALVLCFFLGLLGFHRFYLGRPWAGIAYLLTFWWCPITWLILVIEFFALLCCSDATFDLEYN